MQKFAVGSLGTVAAQPEATKGSIEIMTACQLIPHIMQAVLLVPFGAPDL